MQFENGNCVENTRLQTFTNWPKTDVVAPEVLANDGFIYLGPGDMVQCVFCNGKLRAWEPGCIPRRDHKRYFPQCPYVLGYDVGNVPSRHDNRRNQSLGVYNSSCLSTSGMFSSGATAEATVATIRIKAVTPQMAPRSVRQTSFTSWPLHSIHTSLVNELAEAGFYFSGVGDQMKCFSCDGCLENWTAGDNVWREHAKHFPQCEFLLITKGPEYVADARSTVGQQGATASAATGPKPVKLFHVDPREVRARLDTPRVRNLLSVGYTVAELTVAIEQQLRTTGSDFATLPEFLTALESVRANNKALASSLAQPTPSTGTASSPASVNGNRSSAFIENSGGDSASATAGNVRSRKVKKTRCVQASTEQQATEAEVRTPMDKCRQLRKTCQCRVCRDEDIAVVFLPCGHACTCTGCAAIVTHCPICRQFIRGTVHVTLLRVFCRC